jgi:hypothetical protein
LILMAVTRLHLTLVTFAQIQAWLPLFWVGGVAVLGASVAAAGRVSRAY